MIPLNTQKPERIAFREDGRLDVVAIWNTIQGEGPLAGVPATFVRLAGCNLACPACDTDYTSQREMLAPKDLLHHVWNIWQHAKMWHNKPLIVITGGEPFRQNITPFAAYALVEGYRVQVETNGTLYADDFPYWDEGVSIVCSPKTAKVHKDLEKRVTAFKYVVEAGKVDERDGLPTDVLGSGLRPCRPWSLLHAARADMIFVQPMDSGDPDKNAANTQAAVDSCMKFGYRLSIQVHKLVGLD